ncbi:hypothetical protein ABID19_000172 [Mesorhizobium robiniae]|uniref:Uncharacterized protein n=1 Tax=Mesorhizobium robiniae TaxID=559315 RepID=A0ABV2GG13_9HYPH
MFLPVAGFTGNPQFKVEIMRGGRSLVMASALRSQELSLAIR